MNWMKMPELFWLVNHHTNYEMAKREVLRLQKYITHLKLDDSWRGTTHQFLLHFQEQLRLLDKLVSPSECILNHTHVIFLMTAVEGIPDLCHVKTLDSMISTQSGHQSLNFSNYFNLLLDTAFDHDQVNSNIKDTRHCNIHQNDSIGYDDYDPFTPYEVLDSMPDTNVTGQIHNVTSQSHSEDKPLPVFMPREIWQQLSPAD
ncbi:hypothetical protein ACA910_016001 [Epithemia clementina (nom. ined.)]